MKTNRLSIVAITWVFVFIVLSCDSYTSIEGHVLDENGSPINEAKVEFEFNGGKKEATTNEKGFYSVLSNHYPQSFNKTIKLTISKDGYQTYKQKLSSKENSGRIRRDITLKQQ